MIGRQRVKRKRQNLLARGEATQPSLDQEDHHCRAHLPAQRIDEGGADLVGDRCNERHVGTRQVAQPIGVDRLRARIEDEHADTITLLVAVDGRGANLLVRQHAELAQPRQAVARRRLVPRHGQGGEAGAFSASRTAGVQHRAAGSHRPIGEPIDRQAAHDQRLGHRSIIAGCDSSSTSSTKALRT
ncbi:MAG: hypothetical protein LC798_04960 [Chloroflexi bacterium]|nr:hypothetical protein [Chloroflexota bacterium]